MKKDIDMVLTPRQAAVPEELKAAAARKAGIRERDITGVRFIRKSIDARRKDVKINARNPKKISLVPSKKDSSPLPAAGTVSWSVQARPDSLPP